MNDAVLRHATADDAVALATIYNHYVEHSTATFDTEPKTADERQEWLNDHGADHPVFVAEHDGSVVGWGSLSRFRERAAYRHTAEVAVYLEPKWRGKGIGARLMDALIEAADAAGHHVLVSQIVSDNQASIAMAEKAGFTRVGTMREVGRKFGRWLDVEILQLVLDRDETGETP